MHCRWVFLLLTFFMPLQADKTASDGCRQEIQRIDQTIQKLNVEKQKHIDLARKYQQEGDNWQFRTGRIEDAQANWGRANEERRKAADLQYQIDELLERKDRIYQ